MSSFVNIPNSLISEEIALQLTGLLYSGHEDVIFHRLLKQALVIFRVDAL